VAKIEQIDEVEELNLVLDHYAVTWGNLEGSGIGLVSR
jgi:[phosphatase 2A protein]-leucine-carboxy methyltransferase